MRLHLPFSLLEEGDRDCGVALRTLLRVALLLVRKPLKQTYRVEEVSASGQFAQDNTVYEWLHAYDALCRLKFVHLRVALFKHHTRDQRPVLLHLQLVHQSSATPTTHSLWTIP
jgi:hypothetical protein